MSRTTELLAAFAEYVTPHKRERFAEILAKRTRWLTVALEDLFQAHNTSACLRSCECFGIQDAHIITDRNPFTIEKDVVKGAGQWLTVHQHVGTEAAFSDLRDRGYRILGASPEGECVSVDDIEMDQPTVIVFGTELEGLSDEARDTVDGTVKIPMVGMTESMNVSVACAVMLHTLSSKLRAGTELDSEPFWSLSPEERAELELIWTQRVVRKHWPQLEQRILSEHGEGGNAENRKAD